MLLLRVLAWEGCLLLRQALGKGMQPWTHSGPSAWAVLGAQSQSQGQESLAAPAPVAPGEEDFK